jgi:hypothetical protein
MDSGKYFLYFFYLLYFRSPFLLGVASHAVTPEIINRVTR